LGDYDWTTNFYKWASETVTAVDQNIKLDIRYGGFPVYPAALMLLGQNEQGKSLLNKMVFDLTDAVKNRYYHAELSSVAISLDEVKTRFLGKVTQEDYDFVVGIQKQIISLGRLERGESATNSPNLTQENKR
jgi:hypothetical protein